MIESSLSPTLEENKLAVGISIQSLLKRWLVHVEDWEHLTADEQVHLESLEGDALLRVLLDKGLLTQYQHDRIEARRTFGLLLGNFRVLERIGAGAMGVVFRAEHITLRSQVAIKVVAVSEMPQACVVSRFNNEMRMVASLHHPNIVAAIDAGILVNPNGDSLQYFVMEMVPGRDLEEAVRDQGPLSVQEACDRAYQIAAALHEANKHGLVHRDIKPSNIRVTADGQAKLLDFGLARKPSARMTDPGTLLGTIDYIAPEQARDASRVDIRADLYSLGGTLFFCLTGETPFCDDGNIFQQLANRQTQAPPSIRATRPELPRDLDMVVCRMMAGDPDNRYQTPHEVMEALTPFLRIELGEHRPADAPGFNVSLDSSNRESSRTIVRGKAPCILVVDDESVIHNYCRLALRSEGIDCESASSGQEALDKMESLSPDLVLLDIDMPQMSGTEVLKRLRISPPSPHLKIIMLSGRMAPDELSRLLLAGADDFLSKPLSMAQFLARVKSALRLKDAQERADDARRQMQSLNAHLLQTVTSRDSDLVTSRNALLQALVRLVEARDTDAGRHMRRMGPLCRLLATEAATMPAFKVAIDETFLDLIEQCSPLHDLGKISLPDHILLKPGRLEPDERLQMQTHTAIGGDTLRAIARQHGSAVAFLHMAADIAHHHHEWYDGSGYPDRLTGSDIPLAARIAAIADVYDALRSRRPYKPALSHISAVRIMTSLSHGQFDPALLAAFQKCASKFEAIVGGE